ncbi:hypothetical protein MTO96_010978 [Rhipicephalus appendiculatus]
MKCHWNLHSGLIVLYTCPNWGRAFNQKLHLRTYTSKQPFQHSQCNEHFTELSSAKKHERMMPAGSRPSHLFDDCNPDWAPSVSLGYGFPSPNESRYHRRKERSQRKEADRSDDDRICTQEIKSEEIICGVLRQLTNEVALLVPKREPEEIVCAVDCLDGYFPTHIDSSDGNVGPYSAKSKMEELGITTEGSDGPSLLGPPWLVSQCTK